MVIYHPDVAPSVTDATGKVDGLDWNRAHTITYGSGTYNTVVGEFAGLSISTGENGTFIGAGAGRLNTTGLNNTFVGYVAGALNTDGANNTCVGVNAGTTNTSGFSLTCLGYNAGLVNTTGSSNTFLGTQAGAANTTSSYNVYLGSFAGWVETGQANTYLGYKAGQTSSSGDRNTYVGNSAAFLATTGDDNTVVGYNSGNGVTTGSQNTILGANLTGLSPTLSNTILLADGSGAVRMQIDSQGQVVFGPGAETTTLGSGGVHVGAYHPTASGGFQASSNLVADGSDIGYVDFGTFGTTGSEKRAAAIHGFLVGDATATVTGRLKFYTSNAGVIAERMHLDSLGVDATGYAANGVTGISGTMTTASLVGKTLTFTNGLVTGFA